MTTTTFDAEVLQSEHPVIVDFWAEWCGPCRAVAPVLEQIAEEREAELRVVKVNIDEEPELEQRYGVRRFRRSSSSRAASRPRRRSALSRRRCSRSTSGSPRGRRPRRLVFRSVRVLGGVVARMVGCLLWFWGGGVGSGGRRGAEGALTPSLDGVRGRAPLLGEFLRDHADRRVVGSASGAPGEVGLPVRSCSPVAVLAERPESATEEGPGTRRARLLESSRTGAASSGAAPSVHEARRAGLPHAPGEDQLPAPPRRGPPPLGRGDRADRGRGVRVLAASRRPRVDLEHPESRAPARA